MRISTILAVLFFLSACLPQTQGAPEPRVATTAPVQVTPTLAPTKTRPLPTLTALASPTTNPQPNVTPPPGSSVFLSLGDDLHLLNLATGEDVTGYAPIRAGIHSFSADGRKLAAVEPRGQACEQSGGGTACRPGAGVLHIIDAQTWREVTATLSSENWIGNITFSPDATRLALVSNQPKSSTIMLFDTRDAHSVMRRVIDFRPSLLNFTPDRKALAVYGQALGDNPGISQPPPPRLLLLDAETLQVRWEQTLANVLSGFWCTESCDSHEERLAQSWSPAVIPSHDASQLYIVHADTNQLTTVDLAGRTIHTFEIKTAHTGIENFLALFADTAEAKGGETGVYQYAALSPDGTRLYVVGQTMTTRNSQNRRDTVYAVSALRAIDTTSGRQLANGAMANRQGISEYLHGFDVTPDGTRLFVVRGAEDNTWRTEVFDANTLQPVARLDRWRMLLAQRMDGQQLLLAHVPNSQPLQVGVVDPRTFQVIRSWTVAMDPGWGGWAEP